MATFIFIMGARNGHLRFSTYTCHWCEKWSYILSNEDNITTALQDKKKYNCAINNFFIIIYYIRRRSTVNDSKWQYFLTFYERRDFFQICSATDCVREWYTFNRPSLKPSITLSITNDRFVKDCSFSQWLFLDRLAKQKVYSCWSINIINNQS